MALNTFKVRIEIFCKLYYDFLNFCSNFHIFFSLRIISILFLQEILACGLGMKVLCSLQVGGVSETDRREPWTTAGTRRRSLVWATPCCEYQEIPSLGVYCCVARCASPKIPVTCKEQLYWYWVSRERMPL